MTADSRPDHVAARSVTVHPATSEWGCAQPGCLEKARVIVAAPSGDEFGACSEHTAKVKKWALYA